MGPGLAIWIESGGHQLGPCPAILIVSVVVISFNCLGPSPAIQIVSVLVISSVPSPAILIVSVLVISLGPWPVMNCECGGDQFGYLLLLPYCRIVSECGAHQMGPSPAIWFMSVVSISLIGLDCSCGVVLSIVGSQFSDINCEYGGHLFVSLPCDMNCECGVISLSPVSAI